MTLHPTFSLMCGPTWCHTTFAQKRDIVQGCFMVTPNVALQSFGQNDGCVRSSQISITFWLLVWSAMPSGLESNCSGQFEYLGSVLYYECGVCMASKSVNCITKACFGWVLSNQFLTLQAWKKRRKRVQRLLCFGLCPTYALFSDNIKMKMTLIKDW